MTTKSINVWFLLTPDKKKLLSHKNHFSPNSRWTNKMSAIDIGHIRLMMETFPQRTTNDVTLYLYHSLTTIRDVQQFDLILHLLELGADVNFVTCDGIKPIHRAAICITTDKDTELMLNNAIYELVRHGADVNDQAICGYGALRFAIETGKLTRVKQFLELGADMSGMNINESRTQIEFYCSCDHKIDDTEFESLIMDEYRSKNEDDNREIIDYVYKWKCNTTDIQMTRIFILTLCLPLELVEICGDYIHLLPPTKKRGMKRKYGLF